MGYRNLESNVITNKFQCSAIKVITVIRLHLISDILIKQETNRLEFSVINLIVLFVRTKYKKKS